MSMDFVMRGEKILCISHNTLRLVDCGIQEEVNKLSGIKSDRDVILYKMMTRSNKDMSKHVNVKKDVFDKFMDKIYINAYNKAPMSILYDMTQTLKIQKFIKTIYAMHKKKGIYETSFDNVYYDGSIDSIEKFINDNDITCLIMDDIDAVYEIVIRRKIKLEGMTFMISKLGYNYYRQDGVILLKHEKELLELSDKNRFEFAVMQLFDIDINKIKAKMAKK